MTGELFGDSDQAPFMNILRISAPFKVEMPKEKSTDFLEKTPKSPAKFQVYEGFSEDKMMKRLFSAGLSENMLAQA